MPRLFMFDAYGTLFDVHSAVMQAGSPLGPLAAEFSALWRVKQLEYTWIYSAIGRADASNDFAALTERALDFCLAKFGTNPPGMRAALLDAYRTLLAFPDVAASLSDLKSAGNTTAIFTNGTLSMVSAAISAAGIAGLIDHVVTVEGTGRYKPDPGVYRHAHAAVGSPAAADIVFVSSNRWDVAGAANYGFTPIWCNRTGQPPEYAGPDPITTISDLSGLGGV